MPAGTFAALLIASAASVTAQPVRTGHAEAELIAEVESVAPGDSFWAALRLKPDAGWYVYWSNSGDAGLPPTLDWALPEGWSAGPLQFPWPVRIETPPFASFGYKEEVWYPVRIATASGTASGEPVVLRARAEWLICSDECLPESAALSLAVNVAETRAAQSSPSSAWTERLARLPSPAPDWNWTAEFGEASLRISWDVPEGSDPGDVLFFPLEQGVIEHAAPQSLRHEDGRAILTLDRDPVLLAKPDALRGVLVSNAGWPIGGGESRRAIAVEIVRSGSPSAGGAGIAVPLLIGILTIAALVLLTVFKRPHVNRRNG